jgi:Uma2 family endonuclease
MGLRLEMGTMTATEPLGYVPDGPWSVDDLQYIPDNGMRHELLDGSLLVTPRPFAPHAYVVHRLRRQLERQAPDGVEVSQEAGIMIKDRHTYFVPDLFVVPTWAFAEVDKHLDPADVKLVVEVLCNENRAVDLVVKRHYYAEVGIPRYWIVDPRERMLTVHTLNGVGYQLETTIEAGTAWGTDHPFPLVLDPADFC